MPRVVSDNPEKHAKIHSNWKNKMAAFEVGLSSIGVWHAILVLGLISPRALCCTLCRACNAMEDGPMAREGHRWGGLPCRCWAR
jgi:hypothetical protein